MVSHTLPPKQRELALMALVARKHYLAGQPKTDIAEDLHLSRFQVARLLDRARGAGVVRIEVSIPGPIDLGLATELREEFALEHALVIDASDADSYLLLRELSQATMMLLSQIVTEDDVLGLASARVLVGMSGTAGQFVPCPIVQLTGALSHPEAADIIHTVRTLAHAGGGRPYSFYAPIIAANETAKRTYLRQPDVRRATAMVPKVTVAVLGIGSWEPRLSAIFDGVGAGAQAESTADGVAVEAGGILLDGAGQPVDTAVARRIIAPTFAQLQQARAVVGAVYDAERAEAVRAAIRGGLVNAIVTHRAMAERLLSLPVRRAGKQHGSA
jgi:DNA-binding transcriptional regulator LsrR (DeoR family)